MRSMLWQLGILGTTSAFAYRHRETKKNLCRGGQSQDLPNTDLQPAVRHLKPAVRHIFKGDMSSVSNCIYIYVQVRVWEVDQDMSTANDTIVPLGSTLETYIHNLSPGKVYHMRVLAFSNGGDGRMSSPALTFQMGEYVMQNYNTLT